MSMRRTPVQPLDEALHLRYAIMAGRDVRDTEARPMTLQWDTGPKADTALFMLGGMIPLHLRAEDGAWAMRGVDGRRRTGTAASRREAKLECLKRLEETLKLGMSDLDAAVRELHP